VTYGGVGVLVFILNISARWGRVVNFDNTRTFKKSIKIFLYTNSFYSLNEYYDNNKF